MTGEERVEEMVEVGTEGDGGEVGRSLGLEFQRVNEEQ